MSKFFSGLFCAFLSLLISNSICSGSELKFSRILEKYSASLKFYSEEISRSPNSIRAYSRRGDARFFLGDINGAKLDYEKMIELDPKLKISHWRLGIVYFYLKDFSKAAKQFEIYHNYDNVDRENGIWRFMSQFKQKGLDYAREGLLQYNSTDRPPYVWLYSMFRGELLPKDIFRKINQIDFSPDYKNRVLFHANLYVGIFLELTEGSKERAINYLEKAAGNKYGINSETYMWHVARIHYLNLLNKNH